jgi:hypothetical protein
MVTRGSGLHGIGSVRKGIGKTGFEEQAPRLKPPFVGRNWFIRLHCMVLMHACGALVFCAGFRSCWNTSQ